MRVDKTLAFQLRRSGRSYNEIHRLLKIPKGTLSGWFKNARWSKAQRKRLMAKNQQKWALNLISYNKKRAVEASRRSETLRSNAASEIGALSPRELQLIGAALYWAEGAKTDRWRLKFCNTDPVMVSLMMRFFREACRIPPDKMSARLHLHPHTSEKESRLFWSHLTGIPVHRFNRSQHVLSRSSKGKRPPRRLPHGTIHIAIQSVMLRNRVMGWISGLHSLSLPDA